MGRTRWTGRAGRRGVTRVEVVALLVVLAVVAAIVIQAFDRMEQNYQARARLADVRAQMNAMIDWASFNDGQFPLPSALDGSDATVAETGERKNISANIFSILIWNQSLTPGHAVDEVDPGNVVYDDDYAYDNPPTAVRPAEAQWDPAFNADFTGAVPGNLSWAHQIPTLDEASAWSNRLSGMTPVVSSRGAKMAGIGGTAAEPIPIWADPRSRHLRKSGGRLHWEGAVAYGDGHVTFETSAVPGRPAANPASLPDALFFDEPGPEHAGNAYLSIFTTAGETRRDFTAIWD